MDDTSFNVVVPLLEEIIDQGFYKAEISVNEQEILSQLKRLQRGRLIEIYKQLMNENIEITKWNYLLNKNTYKYFMRKKSSQSLIKDNPEDVKRLEEQFKKRLAELGEVISKRERVQVDLLIRLNDLESERDKLYAIQKDAIDEFDNVTSETGKSLKSLSSGHKLSPETLNDIMAQIGSTRKQISEVRLSFIKTLDRHTQMEVKLGSLQDLGNGLRMNDFSQLREERQCLEEKIEERNNTLEKLRLRCFSDTQILSHVREKKCMLSGTIDEELIELTAIIHEMKITRNYMNNCNAKCEKLRKSYAEMSTSCGLLDKPDLLRNFDETESKFKRKKKSVEKLRKEIEELNNKTNSLIRDMPEVKENQSTVGMVKRNEILNRHGTATNQTIYISPSVLQIKQC